jgi:hypothetical protein
LVDGRPIVLSFMELVSGPTTHLLNPISVQPNGTPVSTDGQVWTGTSANGTPTGADCNGWRLPGSAPTVGDFNAVDSAWTQNTNALIGCTAPNMRIYCFEQAQ